MSKVIKTRTFSLQQVERFTDAGLNPMLAKLLAARGVESVESLESTLKHLIHPSQLLNSNEMAQHLADSIAQHRKLLVVGDYLRSLNFYYLNK